MKNSKTLTVKTSKGLNKTIRKLKRHRKYYVQVRARKVSGGKTLYTNWSRIAAMKTR